MASKNYTEMKGWTLVSGPGWWTGEDAMWIRQTKEGPWIILRFRDLLDAGGKDFEDTPYECDVMWVDLDGLSQIDCDRALQSSGLKYIREENKMVIVTLEGDKIENVMEAAVESLVMYGYGAPLHRETGKRWLHVRAAARRVAEGFLRDRASLDAALDRPVNAIGSTAREYGAGDIDSAMTRLHERVAADKAERSKRAEPVTTFGTLNPDGTLTNVRRVKQSAFAKCPHTIFAPEHYRPDGSCKCGDVTERKRLIKKFGYKAKDFRNIPLRKA